MRWKELSDQGIEEIIARLLRIGVLIAATVVLVGGAAYLVRHGMTKPNYRVFRGEPSDLRTISGIVHDAAGGSSRGLIQLGLLLLIATPIVRVAFSIVAFAIERDRMYVVFTAIVLSVLLYSLLGS
jgi:uncharacterized membrane protein